MKKDIIKRSACTVAAAFIAAAAMSFPSAMKDGKGVSAADTVLKYEFEDGKTSGGKFYTEGIKSKPDEEVKWEISEFSVMLGYFSKLKIKNPPPEIWEF